MSVNAYLPVYTWPRHKQMLTSVCNDVEKIDERIKLLANLMHKTMVRLKGVGLAGPQVGVSRRIITLNVSKPIVLINPVVLDEHGEQTVCEGCLSLPGYFTEMTVPKTISVKYTTLEGETVEETFSNLEAACLLHEIDHLDGKLISDDLTEDQLADLENRVEAIVSKNPNYYAV